MFEKYFSSKKKEKLEDAIMDRIFSQAKKHYYGDVARDYYNFLNNTDVKEICKYLEMVGKEAVPSFKEHDEFHVMADDAIALYEAKQENKACKIIDGRFLVEMEKESNSEEEFEEDVVALPSIDDLY